MTTWRDSASDRAQADLDELLNAVLPFAQQLLEAHGEFFPFGATVDSAGQIALAAADPSKGERPDSQSVLEALYEGVRSDRDNRRAAAFVADVLVDGGDAIRVELEHAEGASMSLALPYSRSRIRKSVSYGQLQAGPGRRRVWTDS
jgi:hypothetical protein